MVIIAKANGESVLTIPENVYQGSNNANAVVLIGAWASSNQVYVSYRLPNGILTTPRLMENFQNVPDEYPTLNAWTIDIDEAITEKYGEVQMQFKVQNVSGGVVATIGCSFDVLRGVAPILPATPSQTIYEQILTALANIDADIDNGWLESKAILPYDANFYYSIGALTYVNDKLYKSRTEDNHGNSVSNEYFWERVGITPDEVATLILTAVEDHNTSATAHEDIRTEISNVEASIPTQIEEHNTSSTAHQDIRQEIETISSDYQPKQDNNLTTADKTIVGAINELDSEIIPATTTNLGVIQVSTDVEASAGENTSKAITPKQLIDNINSAISGVLVYKGLWNTTAETTDFSALNSFRPIKSGWRWEVAGTGCTIEGIEYAVGDFITANQDIGADVTITKEMLDLTDNTENVSSVNGQKGAVVLDAEDVGATTETWVNENILSRQQQVDFDATMEENVITATLDSTNADFIFRNGCSYSIYVHLPLATLTGDLSNNATMSLRDKDNNVIQINCIFQNNPLNTSTIGHLCQVQTYDPAIGYEWEFVGYYNEFVEGQNTIRVIYADNIIRESASAITGADLYTAIANTQLKAGNVYLCTEAYNQNGFDFKQGSTYLATSTWIDGDLVQDVVNITKQDYEIVTALPTAEEGKMIYQKTEQGISIPFSLSDISDPTDFVAKLVSGTATDYEFENFVWASSFVTTTTPNRFFSFFNLGIFNEIFANTQDVVVKFRNGIEINSTLSFNAQRSTFDGEFLYPGTTPGTIEIGRMSNLGYSQQTNLCYCNVQRQQAITDDLTLISISRNSEIIWRAYNADINNLKIGNGREFQTVKSLLGIPSVSTKTDSITDWTNNSATITIPGILPSSVVFISPTPTETNIENFASAGIFASSQATNSLTFTCKTTPTTAISIDVVILNY